MIGADASSKSCKKQLKNAKIVKKKKKDDIFQIANLAFSCSANAIASGK